MTPSARVRPQRRRLPSTLPPASVSLPALFIPLLFLWISLFRATKHGPSSLSRPVRHFYKRESKLQNDRLSTKNAKHGCAKNGVSELK